MWQKAVAGICVMVGAFGFGLSLCQEINSVLLHFKEQRRMLLFMIREISFLHRPMQEIFVAVGERLKEPYPDFLMAVSKRMEQICRKFGMRKHSSFKKRFYAQKKQ